MKIARLRKIGFFLTAALMPLSVCAGGIEIALPEMNVGLASGQQFEAQQMGIAEKVVAGMATANAHYYPVTLAQEQSVGWGGSGVEKNAFYTTSIRREGISRFWLRKKVPLTKIISLLGQGKMVFIAKRSVEYVSAEGEIGDWGYAPRNVSWRAVKIHSLQELIDYAKQENDYHKWGWDLGAK